MFTKHFNKLSKNDVGIAGGKGASLGEMTNAKISVPEGFVVLSSAFNGFLTENNLDKKIEKIIKEVSYEKIDQVDNASKKIRKLIYEAEFAEDIAGEIRKEFKKLDAKFVAVRSSATAEDSSSASWAGELETYLNVTSKDLIESVKKCWSSLFTPRAIFYRFEKKLQSQKVSVAVVVQKMIQSEISGICFTVHPVTKNFNQMVIEAGFGLGEAIVGGMITPDTYIIDKLKAKSMSSRNIGDQKSKVILEKNISRQSIMIVRDASGIKKKKVPRDMQNEQKLTDKQIIKLSEICFKIEKHYNKPQDIEWAFEEGKFYIVQSRPITTL